MRVASGRSFGQHSTSRREESPPVTQAKPGTAPPEKDPKAEKRLTVLWGDLRETQEIMGRQAREPLLNGHDLIRELGLPPGPLIGRLLSGIEEARLTREVTNREGALDWCRREIKD